MDCTVTHKMFLLYFQTYLKVMYHHPYNSDPESVYNRLGYEANNRNDETNDRYTETYRRHRKTQKNVNFHVTFSSNEFMDDNPFKKENGKQFKPKLKYSRSSSTKLKISGKMIDDKDSSCSDPFVRRRDDTKWKVYDYDRNRQNGSSSRADPYDRNGRERHRRTGQCRENDKGFSYRKNDKGFSYRENDKCFRKHKYFDKTKEDARYRNFIHMEMNSVKNIHDFRKTSFPSVEQEMHDFNTSNENPNAFLSSNLSQNSSQNHVDEIATPEIYLSGQSRGGQFDSKQFPLGIEKDQIELFYPKVDHAQLEYMESQKKSVSSDVLNIEQTVNLAHEQILNSANLQSEVAYSFQTKVINFQNAQQSFQNGPITNAGQDLCSNWQSEPYAYEETMQNYRMSLMDEDLRYCHFPSQVHDKPLMALSSCLSGGVCQQTDDESLDISNPFIYSKGDSNQSGNSGIVYLPSAVPINVEYCQFEGISSNLVESNHQIEINRPLNDSWNCTDVSQIPLPEYDHKDGLQKTNEPLKICKDIKYVYNNDIQNNNTSEAYGVNSNENQLCSNVETSFTSKNNSNGHAKKEYSEFLVHTPCENTMAISKLVTTQPNENQNVQQSLISEEKSNMLGSNSENIDLRGVNLFPQPLLGYEVSLPTPPGPPPPPHIILSEDCPRTIPDGASYTFINGDKSCRENPSFEVEHSENAFDEDEKRKSKQRKVTSTNKNAVDDAKDVKIDRVKVKANRLSKADLWQDWKQKHYVSNKKVELKTKTETSETSLKMPTYQKEKMAKPVYIDALTACTVRDTFKRHEKNVEISDSTTSKCKILNYNFDKHSKEKDYLESDIDTEMKTNVKAFNKAKPESCFKDGEVCKVIKIGKDEHIKLQNVLPETTMRLGTTEAVSQMNKLPTLKSAANQKGKVEKSFPQSKLSAKKGPSRSAKTSKASNVEYHQVGVGHKTLLKPHGEGIQRQAKLQAKIAITSNKNKVSDSKKIGTTTAPSISISSISTKFKNQNISLLNLQSGSITSNKSGSFAKSLKKECRGDHAGENYMTRKRVAHIHPKLRHKVMKTSDSCLPLINSMGQNFPKVSVRIEKCNAKIVENKSLKVDSDMKPATELDTILAYANRKNKRLQENNIISSQPKKRDDIRHATVHVTDSKQPIMWNNYTESQTLLKDTKRNNKKIMNVIRKSKGKTVNTTDFKPCSVSTPLKKRDQNSCSEGPVQFQKRGKELNCPADFTRENKVVMKRDTAEAVQNLKDPCGLHVLPKKKIKYFYKLDEFDQSVCKDSRISESSKSYQSEIDGIKSSLKSTTTVDGNRVDDSNLPEQTDISVNPYTSYLVTPAVLTIPKDSFNLKCTTLPSNCSSDELNKNDTSFIEQKSVQTNGKTAKTNIWESEPNKDKRSNHSNSFEAIRSDKVRQSSSTTRDESHNNFQDTNVPRNLSNCCDVDISRGCNSSKRTVSSLKENIKDDNFICLPPITAPSSSASESLNVPSIHDSSENLLKCSFNKILRLPIDPVYKNQFLNGDFIQVNKISTSYTENYPSKENVPTSAIDNYKKDCNIINSHGGVIGSIHSIDFNLEEPGCTSLNLMCEKKEVSNETGHLVDLDKLTTRSDKQSEQMLDEDFPCKTKILSSHDNKEEMSCISGSKEMVTSSYANVGIMCHGCSVSTNNDFTVTNMSSMTTLNSEKEYTYTTVVTKGNNSIPIESSNEGNLRFMTEPVIFAQSKLNGDTLTTQSHSKIDNKIMKNSTTTYSGHDTYSRNKVTQFTSLHDCVQNEHQTIRNINKLDGHIHKLENADIKFQGNEDLISAEEEMKADECIVMGELKESTQRAIIDTEAESMCFYSDEYCLQASSGTATGMHVFPKSDAEKNYYSVNCHKTTDCKGISVQKNTYDSYEPTSDPNINIETCTVQGINHECNLKSCTCSGGHLELNQGSSEFISNTDFDAWATRGKSNIENSTDINLINKVVSNMEELSETGENTSIFLNSNTQIHTEKIGECISDEINSHGVSTVEMTSTTETPEHANFTTDATYLFNGPFLNYFEQQQQISEDSTSTDKFTANTTKATAMDNTFEMNEDALKFPDLVTNSEISIPLPKYGLADIIQDSDQVCTLNQHYPLTYEEMFTVCVSGEEKLFCESSKVKSPKSLSSVALVNYCEGQEIEGPSIFLTPDVPCMPNRHITKCESTGRTELESMAAQGSNGDGSCYNMQQKAGVYGNKGDNNDEIHTVVNLPEMTINLPELTTAVLSHSSDSHSDHHEKSMALKSPMCDKPMPYVTENDSFPIVPTIYDSWNMDFIEQSQETNTDSNSGQKENMNYNVSDLHYDYFSAANDKLPHKNEMPSWDTDIAFLDKRLNLQITNNEQLNNNLMNDSESVFKDSNEEKNGLFIGNTGFSISLSCKNVPVCDTSLFGIFSDIIGERSLESTNCVPLDINVSDLYNEDAATTIEKLPLKPNDKLSSYNIAINSTEKKNNEVLVSNANTDNDRTTLSADRKSSEVLDDVETNSECLNHGTDISSPIFNINDTPTVKTPLNNNLSSESDEKLPVLTHEANLHTALLNNESSEKYDNLNEQSKLRALMDKDISNNCFRNKELKSSIVPVVVENKCNSDESGDLIPDKTSDSVKSKIIPESATSEVVSNEVNQTQGYLNSFTTVKENVNGKLESILESFSEEDKTYCNDETNISFATGNYESDKVITEENKTLSNNLENSLISESFNTFDVSVSSDSVSLLSESDTDENIVDLELSRVKQCSDVDKQCNEVDKQCNEVDKELCEQSGNRNIFEDYTEEYERSEHEMDVLQCHPPTLEHVRGFQIVSNDRQYTDSDTELKKDSNGNAILPEDDLESRGSFASPPVPVLSPIMQDLFEHSSEIMDPQNWNALNLDCSLSRKSNINANKCMQKEYPFLPLSMVKSNKSHSNDKLLYDSALNFLGDFDERKERKCRKRVQNSDEMDLKTKKQKVVVGLTEKKEEMLCSDRNVKKEPRSLFILDTDIRYKINSNKIPESDDDDDDFIKDTDADQGTNSEDTSEFRKEKFCSETEKVLPSTQTDSYLVTASVRLDNDLITTLIQADSDLTPTSTQTDSDLLTTSTRADSDLTTSTQADSDLLTTSTRADSDLLTTSIETDTDLTTSIQADSDLITTATQTDSDLLTTSTQTDSDLLTTSTQTDTDLVTASTQTNISFETAFLNDQSDKNERPYNINISCTKRCVKGKQLKGENLKELDERRKRIINLRQIKLVRISHHFLLYQQYLTT